MRTWGLREDVVEKDYALGWVLWGIGADSLLGRTWVFKGGTCLKKCYIETYRFSEDLDFTVLEDGPIEPEEVLAAVERVLDRVSQESGIDFAVRPPICRSRPSGASAEGRLYYRWPRNAPGPASIKLDLTKPESTDRSLTGRAAGLPGCRRVRRVCRRSPGGAAGGPEPGAVAQRRPGALRARARGCARRAQACWREPRTRAGRCDGRQAGSGSARKRASAAAS